MATDRLGGHFRQLLNCCVPGENRFVRRLATAQCLWVPPGLARGWHEARLEHAARVALVRVLAYLTLRFVGWESGSHDPHGPRSGPLSRVAIILHHYFSHIGSCTNARLSLPVSSHCQ